MGGSRAIGRFLGKAVSIYLSIIKAVYVQAHREGGGNRGYFPGAPKLYMRLLFS